MFRLWACVLVATLAACFSLRQLAPDETVIPKGCGNGQRDADEACDPSAPLGPRACVLRADGAGGAIAGCSARCEIEIGSCVTPDDERLSLWLSGEAADAPGALVDRRSPSATFVFQRDGVTRAADILSLSTNVAVPRQVRAQEARAHDLTLGTGHSVFIAPDISAATPITYELWIAPTAATPGDREVVVFQHENGCTLSLVNLRVRATCGTASVEHPVTLTRDAYVFVVVEVARAVLTMRVGDASVTTTNAPVSIERGRFAVANTLTTADGTAKQFVGRIDDLRIFASTRTDEERCADRGSDACP